MKKIIGATVAGFVVLGGAVALLLAEWDGVGPVPARVVVEKAKNVVEEQLGNVLGLGGENPGVVATVNGTAITLNQVEALYDMSMPSLAAGTGALDELRADYASHLQRLIMQLLIRQELEARKLPVSDDEVRKLEGMISAGYDVRPGTDFNRYIEEEGVLPDMWREQLRARLELERWQTELTKTVVISAAEVEAHVAAHPEDVKLAERVTCLFVTGKKQAEAEAARKSGETDVDALRNKGLDVRRVETVAMDMPEAWKELIAPLAPGDLSPVRSLGNAWRYVILLERTPPRTLTPVEIYTRVAHLLAEKRLPDLFDVWLEQAISTADIRMAHALLPGNIPKPAPSSRLTEAFSSTPDSGPLVTGSAGEEDEP